MVNRGSENQIGSPSPIRGWLIPGGLSESSGCILRNHQIEFFVYLLAVVFVLVIRGGSPPMVSVDWFELGLIPVGVWAGALGLVFVHNAAHGNFPGRWMNQVVGELCGGFLLLNFLSWKVAHLLHHQFPDDEEMDRGSGEEPSLPRFRWNLQYNLRLGVGHIHRRIWGAGKSRLSDIRLARRLGERNVWVKVLFWFVLLGPKYMLLVFLPSYLSSGVLAFYFKYRMHVRNGDGVVEIVDSPRSSLLYRFLNAVLLGVFHHRRHHAKPHLFNPAPPFF